MKSIFLYPGQLVVTSEPAVLSTMLGSCVGIALWDQTTGIGGLNHYLLPEVMTGETPSPRYGSFAVPTLIDECLRSGARSQNLIAKVFGGAAVLGDLSIGTQIGRKNIDLALALLKGAGIRIASQETGGEKGRKIAFNTATGEVSHSFTGDGGVVDISGFGKLEVEREVKVLIVDDSATVRLLFERTFKRAGLTVVGAASNPFEARDMIAKLKPDVITLDIEMPRMNGVRFLEKIMQHMPIPTVMVSSLDQNGQAALEAMRLGAVEFMQKPTQADPELLRQFGEILVGKVRAAAAAKLGAPRRVESPPTASSRAVSHAGLTSQISGIFVSGNTGAPKSLQKMLSSFTSDTPPVVVAVSTVGPFLDAYLADLKKATKLSVQAATKSTLLTRGTIYFIPENMQGRVRGTNGQMSLDVAPGAPVSGQTPSGDVLLGSAAEAMGASAVGILLSGFGGDGVAGLGKIHGKGGLALAESPADATFPFVPQTAINQGIVSEVVHASDIFKLIMSYRDRRSA